MWRATYMSGTPPCPPRWETEGRDHPKRWGLPLGVGASLLREASPLAGLANDRIHNVGASLLANYAIREQARSHAVVCQTCRLLATLFRNLGVIVLGQHRFGNRHGDDVA